MTNGNQSVFGAAIQACIDELPEGKPALSCRRGRTQPLKQMFEEYHAEHPEVYQWIIHFAHEMQGAGHSYYGMKSIIERVRWHVNLRNPDKPFKINNVFAPFYARLVMDNEPEFKGFFRLREQHGI